MILALMLKSLVPIYLALATVLNGDEFATGSIIDIRTHALTLTPLSLVSPGVLNTGCERAQLQSPNHPNPSTDIHQSADYDAYTTLPTSPTPNLVRCTRH